MKWETHSILPIKVSKIVFIPKWNNSYQKSHNPDAGEDGRGLTFPRVKVAEGKDDDQELLQRQVRQQQDGDF